MRSLSGPRSASFVNLNFGRLGRVAALPVELQEIETEAKVRVLEVELEDGDKVVLPRANVEIIEV